MLKRYSRIPIDNPRQVIVAVSLLTLLVSPFILKVEFATDVEAFLPQSEEVQTYDTINADFGQDSSVVYLYLTSVSGGNVLNMDNLEDILELHDSCSKLLGVKDVISVGGFFDSALRDSGLSLNEVKNADNPWQLVYDSISKSDGANYSWNEVDFVGDVLINKDLNLNPLLFTPVEGSFRSEPIANSTLIMINLVPEITINQKKEIGQQIRILALSHNSESGSDIQAEPFSVALLAYDVDQSTQTTNFLMSMGMFFVTVILLWLTFRHWSYVVLPLMTLILSVFWTFAFAGMAGITLTALDVAVIPLVVGLGIDFSVHISRRYQESLSSGNSIEDSLVDAQVHTGQALFLAMFTTVVAFLSGISGGVGPVRDFSLLCAVGIFSSFILTLFFYTSMRYILDSNSTDSIDNVQDSKIIENSISRAAEIVDKHPQVIVSSIIIITLLALGGASQIETSFSLDDFLSDDLEIMSTAEHIQSDFSGASYLQSQILFTGPVATTAFFDGVYEFQCGQEGICVQGLNNDRYVIKVGSTSRVESVYEIVVDAVSSDEYSTGKNSNETHEWITTNSFRVVPTDDLDLSWSIVNPALSPSVEVTVLWYDESSNFIGSDNVSKSLLDTNLSNRKTVSVAVPSEAFSGRFEFKYIKNPEDHLIYDINVHDSEKYIYVQSILNTFNLEYKNVQSKNIETFDKTTDQDIVNLYDYLYQRDLDVADPFTGESYSDKIKHVLHRNEEGNYTSSVVRVFIGATSSHELDNDGLEFMRDELAEDIPSDFESSDYQVSITGGHVLTSVTVNEIQSTQISSTLTSIILAAAILIVLYRNLGFGLISTLPTILATVWIMATMTILGITLNVLTVMVTALTIGLGIDYAIHIVERYREEIIHKSERQAIETTIKRTGSALLISGLTTFCGFAVLFLSPMPLVRNFGIITAATIIYSVFIAIFVLPSLIWTTNRIKEWSNSDNLLNKR